MGDYKPIDLRMGLMHQDNSVNLLVAGQSSEIHAAFLSQEIAPCVESKESKDRSVSGVAGPQEWVGVVTRTAKTWRRLTQSWGRLPPKTCS